MSRRAELEREVLAALLRAPDLLNSTDLLEATLFSDTKFREIFSGLTKVVAEHGPDAADDFSTARASGLPLFEVSAISAGAYHPARDNFVRMVRDLAVQVRGERLVALTQAEARALVKTGDVASEVLAKIRVEFEALDHVARDGQPGFIRRLDEVQAREIEWLWRGRVPLGMFSLLAGDPGLGKSFLATWLACRLSRGEPLPDDSGPAISGSTIIFAAEDSPAFALRPRATVNGAELSKFHFVSDPGLGLEVAVDEIKRFISTDPSVRLVIFDPLNSFLAGCDYFKDTDVRHKLSPVISFAEDSHVAVLGIMHLNKKTDSQGLYRLAGSVAFSGLARSIMAVVNDPEDPDRRILRPLKMNYARRPDALAFRIRDDRILAFDDGCVQMDADEPLSAPPGPTFAEGSFACEWLRERLTGGPTELATLLSEAQKAEISRAALFRARRKLDVHATYHSRGFSAGRKTFWALPGAEDE